MKKDKLLKRCIVLVIGLFIMAIGVALSIKANLGTSPVSCVPYVYSLGFPMTVGLLSIIVNVLMILLQIVLLRKDYQLIQLVQLPVALIFGFFIDFAMFLLSGLQSSNYIYQWILCLLSCVIIAFGVFLEVKANVTYLAGEGLSIAISKAFHKEFGKAKVGVDASLVIIGVASSFILLHKLEGIREGTIAAALLVGTIARFYNKKFKFIDPLVSIEKKEADEQASTSGQEKRVIITIAREFGSGGHEIGEIIAKELGISFYDTKLIDLSAAESGLTPEYVKEHEQKLANSLLFDLYEQNYAYVNEEMPPLDTLFMIQSKIIRDISEKESCVIVGRCADYVLKSNPNCFNTFVHADKKYRIKRIINDYGIDQSMAEKELERKDRDRTNYCKHYTHRIWGMASNYNLAVDSSLFGPEKSAMLIIEALHKYIGKE
ncbi:cytidylate kinase family protein [uncultured Bacteroides sp.]|uniref:cytidylate kinase family protein n=1 Tax=uncultured Bacteroides sp. TaxID=162156 RepID=UPI002AABF059|nr:cytidylate kinase family protein [uncultured Bacteroides sp.]